VLQYLVALEAEQSNLQQEQINIIEAHEKGHGLRDFRSSIDRAEIKSVSTPLPYIHC
jgi:hypothetical protein